MDKTPFFSIIIVCLNPGNKLMETVDSIHMQSCKDYEIIVKDGYSIDGSIEKLKKNEKSGFLHIFQEKDKSIYDAMNQASNLARGKFVYFLNCGDLFYDREVLIQVKDNIEHNLLANSQEMSIYYGNIFETITGQVVQSNTEIDQFACYRNVPCHQACFYQRELLLLHPFEIHYRVRADYEQFLWCALDNKAGLYYMPIIVAYYEGGGFSETKVNRKISTREHREIVERYMSQKQILQYRIIMWLSLAPLRTLISRNQKTAATYNWIKKFFYKIR